MQAKAWLTEQGVAFEAKDVVSSPENLQEMVERSRGLRSVPTIFVGDEMVRGFDKERLKALLGLA